MGLFKKIFKPVRKVLDKVIPNEIKPFLPYAAAAVPFLAPTSGIFGTMAGRALLSGGANIASQLAQEGTTEDDLNLLSAGIATLTGALSAPQVSKGITTSPQEFFGMRADLASEGTGVLSKAKELGFKGLSKGSGFLSTQGEILRDPFAAGTTLKELGVAASIPAAQGTGDALYAEGVRINKQQIIDDALGGLEEGATDADRALAIRIAMRNYGFSEDEIDDTIVSAGYKAGGRVGLRFGGIGEAIEKIEDQDMKESMEFAADMGDMDIPMMDIVEEFEIKFKRKPNSLQELKDFYKDKYEYKGPADVKMDVEEKMVMKAKDGGRINFREGGVLSQILPQVQPFMGRPAFAPTLQQAEAVFPRLNQLEQGINTAEQDLGKIRERLGDQPRQLISASQRPIGLQPTNMLSIAQLANRGGGDLQGMKDGGRIGFRDGSSTGDFGRDRFLAEMIETYGRNLDKAGGFTDKLEGILATEKFPDPETLKSMRKEYGDIEDKFGKAEDMFESFEDKVSEKDKDTFFFHKMYLYLFLKLYLQNF